MTGTGKEDYFFTPKKKGEIEFCTDVSKFVRLS